MCGPIHPNSASGKKYFFLLVDDYSCYMWVYFLKRKDEAFSAFKNFCALVERGEEMKVRVFRTDRGGAFGSNEFKMFCKKGGIKRHYTVPYTPQQNGVVERRNRTVVEMARSCLKETKLPPVLWGEAIRHSIYLLNRLPTRALTGITPYEAWNERKPHIGHIRVFGCIAHMKIPSQHTNKLDDRSREVVNLGKETGTKAYCFYDPVNNTIWMSRVVTFEENKSWVWEHKVDNLYFCNGTFTVESAAVRDEENVPDNVDKRNTDDENTTDTQATNSQSEANESPRTQSTAQVLNPNNYDDSVEPKRVRNLQDIYNETDELELEEELILTGI